MLEAIMALAITTALLLGSPGPATISLAAAGAGFGVRQSLGYLLGILTGLSVAISVAALGLAELFEQYSDARLVMQIIGSLYLVYVAYKIASAPVISNDCESLAPKFIDGFLLNLFNVKAYAAFLAIFSKFLLPIEQSLWAYSATAGICFLVAVVVDSLWLWFGGIIRPWFTAPKQARLIRISFALLMLIALALTLV